MRRLLCIAAFALLLAVPVWAQRGGGHGGGGHAGFGGGHGGGFSGHGGFSGGHVGGGHFSGGMRGGGFSHISRPGFSRRPFLHDGFRNGFRNGFHGRFRDRDDFRSGFRNGFHGRFRDRDDFRSGFRNNCFGWRCGGWGYPWWGYDPWLWDWWDHSSYDDDYYRNLATANQMNEQSLEQQRMLRQEEADGDQDAYARRDEPPQRAAGDEKPGTPFMPATVLVFRDQHKEEIENYAIVGQTLWNFAPQRTERISLAQLDLPATTKANDDRGISFNVPAANQAQ